MSTVTITRGRDPWEGEQVAVLRRWRRRHGRIDLLVVLPDGRKRLIPRAWTDAEPAGDAAQENGPVATLGGIEDLLAAVVVVSALGKRTHGEQAAAQSTCEEDSDAACPAQSAAGAVSGATGDVVGPASRRRPAPRGRSGSPTNYAACSSPTPPTAGSPSPTPAEPSASPARPFCTRSSAANSAPCSPAPGAGKACVSRSRPRKTPCSILQQSAKEQCDHASNAAARSASSAHSRFA
jgi:hypothetical protein